MCLNNGKHMKKALKADTFDVYGWPPGIVLKDLDGNSQRALRRYVENVTSKVYRIAFDAGYGQGARDEYKASKHRPKLFGRI